MTAVNTTLYGKQGNEKFALNPSTTADQVAIPDEQGQVSDMEAEIIKLRQQLNAVANAGIHFKGVVTQAEPLPTVAYKSGWQYSVGEAGTYAGVKCEVGDFIICIRDYASGSASNADWSFLQANLTGAVTGPESAVAAHVAIFDGTAGNKIKDSGFTIAKSVPADAKFTDTTYAVANAQADGLLSASMFTKLMGIETGADKTTPERVREAGAFMINEHTADNIRDGASNVVMTTAERQKLQNLAAWAEVNQNAFSKVKVGDVEIKATAKEDMVEIEAGEGLTITADPTTKKVKLSMKYRYSCVVDSLDKVPADLAEGGLIILK